MKRMTKWMIAWGAATALLLAGAIWQAETYNEGRLVAPMDFSVYQFRAADLPMLLALGMVCIYVITLFILLFRKNLRLCGETNTTRKLNPRLGYLGFLGLLGFAGFWTYSVDKTVFPFCFFMFFGFFGFFFEGKMSDTYMDERYRENADRAQMKALKVGYAIQFLLLLLVGQGALLGNLEYTLILFVVVTALSLALVQFLSVYLLYRYDQGDQGGEEA